MLFSVLIPVYNVEGYLEECIESVLIQELEDYEIILVDDGSTDSSGKICDSYKEMYPDFIKVIHKENEGLLMARRDAISVARGEYILFCDSDDYFAEGAFRKLKKVIDEMEPDVILYNIGLSRDGKIIGKLSNIGINDDKFEFSDKTLIYDNLLVTKCNFSSLAMKCCRKNCVGVETDYYQFKGLNYGEDLLQSIEIYTNAQKIIYINADIYFYRVGTGMTGKYNPNYYIDFKRINKVIKEYKTKWNLEDFNYKCSVNYLKFSYGSIRQMKNIREMESKEMIQYMKMIAEDIDFRNSYRVVASNEVGNNFLKKKEKLVLFLLFHRLYRVLRLLVKGISKSEEN